MHIKAPADLTNGGLRLESADGNQYATIDMNNSGNLRFYQNGVSRMRIDSNGNVGIGTASPNEKLHINGNIKVAVNDVAEGLGYHAVMSSAYSDNAFTLSSCGKKVLEMGGYNNANTMKLYTGNTERARIDSSGNLLVGKTVLDVNTLGHQFMSDASGDYAAHTSNNTRALLLNRKGTDGEIVNFRKDGTTVGSIGSYSGLLTVGHGDVGLVFSDGGDSILPINQSANTLRDAAIQLGDATRRFKDLYLSGGVYLGGTGAANKLDDYEEGLWTPTIFGSTTAGSYNNYLRGGKYTKVGNKVTVAFYVSGTGGTGSGELRLGGLPFAIDYSDASGVPFANAGLIFNSGWSPMWIADSTTDFKIRAMNPSGGNYQPVSYPTSISYLRGTLIYFTND